MVEKQLSLNAKCWALQAQRANLLNLHQSWRHLRRMIITAALYLQLLTAKHSLMSPF